MKMRAILFAGLLAAAIGPRPAFAFTPLDIVTEIRVGTEFTALEGFGAAYYYSAKEGSDSASQGGVNNRVFTYRSFLTANIGWKNALNGREIGNLVGGPGVVVDNLLDTLFPKYSQTIYNMASPDLRRILDAHFINAWGGWKSSNGAFDYGYATGLEVRF